MTSRRLSEGDVAQGGRGFLIIPGVSFAALPDDVPVLPGRQAAMECEAWCSWKAVFC